MTDQSPIDDIVGLFQGLGNERYSDDVTQEAHALQAAFQAEQAGVSKELVVAALLHDIGHLLHKRGHDAAARGINARHERIGASYLDCYFGAPVSEPVRLHVAAKRYLCGVEPDYFATLSPGSVRSLELQGGPMSKEAADRFIAHPFAEPAVQLRRWDEGAKVAGLATPAFAHFIPAMTSCLKGVRKVAMA